MKIKIMMFDIWLKLLLKKIELYHIFLISHQILTFPLLFLSFDVIE